MPRRVGGLRGGYAVVRNRGGLALRGVRYVTGVRVSGSAPRDGTTRLTIHGGGALRGHIVVSADLQRVSGRLGGRRFSIVRSTAASRSARLPDPRDALRAFALRIVG